MTLSVSIGALGQQGLEQEAAVPARPQPLRFRKEQHLRLQRDFTRVFERRCSVADANLVVYVDANEVGFSRLGLSVGRRVGGAVTRNRIKRLIREAFRLSQHDLPGGLDIICVARVSPAATMDDYRRSLGGLVEKAFYKYGRNAKACDA